MRVSILRAGKWIPLVWVDQLEIFPSSLSAISAFVGMRERNEEKLEGRSRSYLNVSLSVFSMVTGKKSSDGQYSVSSRCSRAGAQAGERKVGYAASSKSGMTTCFREGNSI